MRSFVVSVVLSLLSTAAFADSFPVDVTILNNKCLRLRELGSNGANNWCIKSPASMGANYTLTMPADDGTAGQVLSTDGSGVTSWVSAATLNGVTDGSTASAGQIGERLTEIDNSINLDQAANTQVATFDVTAGSWRVFLFLNGAFTGSTSGVCEGYITTAGSCTGISDLYPYFNMRGTGTTTAWGEKRPNIIVNVSSTTTIRACTSGCAGGASLTNGTIYWTADRVR